MPPSASAVPPGFAGTRRRALKALALGAILTAGGGRAGAALQDATQTPLPSVVVRARKAVRGARTYRYETYGFDAQGNRTLYARGEVDLKIGQKVERPDEPYPTYFSEGYMLYQTADGSWSISQPPVPTDEVVMTLVNVPDRPWTEFGADTVDGRVAEVVEFVGYHGAVAYLIHLWIDAETFLPLKSQELSGIDGSLTAETTYADFGQPVDVQAPAEALALRDATVTAITDSISAQATESAAEVARREQLISDLLATPFTDDELPDGFAGAVAGPADMSELSPLGADAAVAFTFAEPPGDQRLTFALLYSADAVDTAISTLLNEASTSTSGHAVSNIVVTDTRTGDGVDVVYQQIGGDTVATGLARRGEVLIIAVTAALGGSVEQAETNAANLAFAGLRHLDRIRSA